MLLAIGGTSSALVLHELASTLWQFDARPDEALRQRSLGTSTVVLIVAGHSSTASYWKTGFEGPDQVTCFGWQDGQVVSQPLLRQTRVPVVASGEPLRPLFRTASRFVSGELVLMKKTGVEVPLIWNDVNGLAQAMDLLGSLVDREQVVEVAVMNTRAPQATTSAPGVDAVRVRVTLTPNAARLDVVPWTGVTGLDALLSCEPPPLAWGTVRAGAYQKPRRTKHKPFITGHAKARVKAIPSRATRADEDLLLEALIDPANAGPFFEEVRKALYGSLSWLESAAVEAAFRAGLRLESDPVASHLAALAWRQKGAIHAWAKTDLVEAWTTDRRFAERILMVFAEAMFVPPREWLHGAPAELLAQLDDLARRQGRG